jgi:hypothetical protein
VREIDAQHIPVHWPEVSVRRRTTPAIVVGRCLQMGRITQFPVRYHLTSTIHRIQGETIALYATQVSQIQREYRLWQKKKFAVLISRAEQCGDIIFVGSPADTKAAIVNILERSSKWDSIIGNYISALDVLSHPPIREISLQLHPFKPLYRELPTASCGYVYLLASITKPRNCYVGETDNLKACLRKHNTGYGAEETRPINLHPWGVFGFVCGFDDEILANGIRRRQEFFTGLRYDTTRGPEAVYACMQAQVAEWCTQGDTRLVIVKCGELQQ